MKDVVRDFRDKHVIGVLGEHACYIQGHVAVTNHGNFLGSQRPFPGDIGVSVIPGDEVRAPVGTFKLDAGDVQIRVLDGAGGEDDGIVVLLQVFQR